MFHWLKRMHAGRTTRRPGSPPIRRARPAVEALEPRLVPAAANLLGDHFVLKDSTGFSPGEFIIVAETRKTGAFTGAFFPTISLLGAIPQGTGRINGSRHFQIQFSGTGFFNPAADPSSNFERIDISLTGDGKGQGKKASLKASVEIVDFFRIGGGAFRRDLTFQVSAHAS